MKLDQDYLDKQRRCTITQDRSLKINFVLDGNDIDSEQHYQRAILVQLFNAMAVILLLSPL